MKMRKLVAMTLAVLLLCSIIPFSVAAADHSATIDFTDKANRTAYSTEQQVWEQNGIIVTNDKGASTSNVGDYGGDGYPARFYKSSTVVIEYPGMTKIVIDCTGLEAKYVTGWSDSFSANATATVDGSIVTIVLAEAADSFTWEKMSAQSRAYSITVYTGEGGTTPDTPVDPEPDQPDTPDQPTGSLGVITNPVEGVAYKLGLNQTQKGAIYYFTGTMSSYYGATDTSVDNAVDMYVEIVDGGYKLYFNNGSKQYIKLEQSGTHYNFTFGATGSVFTLDTDLNAFYAPCGDAICYMGTYGTYVTVGCLTEEKLKESDYIARLYGEESETPDTPDTPVDPDTPDTPDTPDEPNYDDEIDTTIPYLLGMIQENVSTEDVYFLNGEMNSYYMDTTTDEESAIWVYLEKTNGGYYLYALDENDDKVYINMVVSGTHVNGAYEYAASTVYNYDWDLYTLVAEVNGDIYAFGTRNDKQYTTMGPVKVSYNGFHADLYYFEDDVVDPCEHEYDNACDDECNLCGELREVGDHEYSTAYDEECNNCGYIRDLPVYGGAIAVNVNSAHAGENVNIAVQVDNNPGIVSVKVKVYFDNTLLEFVSATEGDFSASGYSWSDFEVVQEKGYVIINWCDATKPNSMANLLATLTFKVKDDAPAGITTIWPEFNCEADIFNADDKTVYFDAVGGGVEILDSVEVMPGDVNGDGKVNNRDLGVLQKYLNGGEIAADEAASDLNGDGKINNRDLGLLQKLLNA